MKEKNTNMSDSTHMNVHVDSVRLILIVRRDLPTGNDELWTLDETHLMFRIRYVVMASLFLVYLYLVMLSA